MKHMQSFFHTVQQRCVPGNAATEISSKGIDLASNAFLARRQYPHVPETNIVIRPIFVLLFCFDLAFRF